MQVQNTLTIQQKGSKTQINNPGIVFISLNTGKTRLSKSVCVKGVYIVHISPKKLQLCVINQGLIWDWCLSKVHDGMCSSFQWQMCNSGECKECVLQ